MDLLGSRKHSSAFKNNEWIYKEYFLNPLGLSNPPTTKAKHQPKILSPFPPKPLSLINIVPPPNNQCLENKIIAA